MQKNVNYKVILCSVKNVCCLLILLHVSEEIIQATDDIKAIKEGANYIRTDTNKKQAEIKEIETVIGEDTKIIKEEIKDIKKYMIVSREDKKIINV